MLTVISWLTAIRDAILDFLDILKILQQIADNLSPATKAHIIGRRSFGQNKRLVKGKLQSSAIDEYSYEWVALNNPDVAQWTSTGMYRLNGNAQWTIYLGYGERVNVKVVLVSDTEGATYSLTLVSPDIVIGDEDGAISSVVMEHEFQYTAIGNNDYVVIDLSNQLPTDLLVFSLNIKVQTVTANVQTEPEEDDYTKERFNFDLPLEQFVPRLGNYFFDGEGWQISGNGSEIRSERQEIITAAGMRLADWRLTLEVDVAGQLDVYIRLLEGLTPVGEMGYRLGVGPAVWATVRPLRSLPFPPTTNPFFNTGNVTSLAVAKSVGYRYELTMVNDTLNTANQDQLDNVDGFQLIFRSTTGSNQRITFGYWAVNMTSNPYSVA